MDSYYVLETIEIDGIKVRIIDEIEEDIDEFIYEGDIDEFIYEKEEDINDFQRKAYFDEEKMTWKFEKI